MKTGSWKVFFAILAATIVIAWVTGMLIVRGHPAALGDDRGQPALRGGLHLDRITVG